MSNMSYCRFENTLADLRDCAANIENELEAEGTEDRARARLIKVAFSMVQPYLINAGSADMRMSIQLDTEAINELPHDRD